MTLGADTAKFEQGMRRAQSQAAKSSGAISKSLSGIKAGFAGLAAGLSIGLITRAIVSALDYAGSLKEVADTLGVTTRDLQTFRFAASQVGVSQEALETGLAKLTLTMGKLAAGAKAPRDALEAVRKGLADQVMNAGDAGNAFRILADALKPIESRAQRSTVEFVALGKAGAKLDNLLVGGSQALNELADAAERLGIVLSDEQIKNADEAADKLAAVKTVISANIAGVVADNADAIVELANAFGQLVAVLAQVGGWLVRTGQDFGNFAANAPAWAKAIENAILPVVGLAKLVGAATAPRGSSSVTTKLPEARRPGGGGTASVGQFLAPGGGSRKRGGTDRTAEDKLRDSFQFDQEIRRAQMDVLRAQQDLAGNYIERTTIGIEILNAEKAARDAEHQYQIALFKLTKGKQGLSEAQVAQLEAQENITDSLERQALLDEEQAQRAEDVQSLTQADFDRRKDALQSQLQIAETAEERRKIELELLQIAYDQRRQAIQNIIDTSKDIAAIENARRDLLNLNKTFGNDRQAVINDTRGPMEDFLASLPTTAAKANEALEQLQVQGFNGLIDSVLALSEGVGSATDSLLDTLKNFFLGLARLELQKLLGSALGEGGFLSGLGFASGGFTGNISSNKIAGFVHGSEGVLNTRAMRKLGVPALNALNRGAPLSAVLNDNGPRMMGGRGDVYMTVVTPDSDSFRRSEGQTTRGLKRKLA